MRRYTKNMLVMIWISFFIVTPAPGSEIFHWVDEDGVLNFSDWAPENSNVEVAKLVVSNSNPPGYDPDEDQNSVLGQADRMNIRWAALKEKQEERRKQRLELEEQQRRLQPVVYDYPYYNDSFFYYRPVHRPGLGHRRPFKVQKRQFGALDQLGLTGPRPHSINSSAHLARINAGKALNGNFRPHRPAKMPHASTYKEW
jgi:hypothetical protein